MSTFVFVHGAWQASWCWREVISRLEARHHRVVTIDLPGHGHDPTPRNEITLEHYTEALTATIQQLDEPPLMVAHSMGGVLTAWAETSPNVARALVYIAANIPPNGASMLALVDQYDPGFPASFVWAGDGKTAAITLSGAREFLYPQCPEPVVREVLPMLTPEPVAPFQTPIVWTPERFGRVRRFYIETLQDRAVPFALQRSIQHRVGFERVFTLDTDHSPFFSAPGPLVSCLDAISSAT